MALLNRIEWDEIEFHINHNYIKQSLHNPTLEYEFDLPTEKTAGELFLYVDDRRNTIDCPHPVYTYETLEDLLAIVGMIEQEGYRIDDGTNTKSILNIIKELLSYRQTMQHVTEFLHGKYITVDEE